jgi:hypothetical protein
MCDYPSAVIHNETNTRLFERNIPSSMLQPYFSPRGVSTKYSLLPIVDPRKSIDINVVQCPVYNSHATFNPGNTKSPWSGFSANINTESELRNQIYALQKCSQSVYVPGSGSDLYVNDIAVASNTTHQKQPFSELFAVQQFEPFNPNPNPATLGNGVFLNSTRAQVKNLDMGCV